MSATVSLRTQSLGDLAVQNGDLRLRQWAPWLAYLECPIGSAPAAGEAATLVVRREDETETTFTGTARRAGVVPGSESLFVSLVGGAGKLLDELPAVDHVAGSTPVLAGLVARRIADDAGELLADGVEAALDARTLQRWHRASGMPGAVALDLLAAELGYVWRVLPSGRIWIGAETWPETAAPTYITEDPDDGSVTYAPDGAPIVAGQLVAGVRVVEAAYTFAPGKLRLSVRGAVAGDPPRSIDRELYGRAWGARVLAQRSDGTLDLRADDARIGELLAVPFRLGIPGALVTVPEGARLRVRFEGASPAGAYACDIDQDTAATKAFSLLDDVVDVGTFKLVVGSVTYTPPGGPPTTIIAGQSVQLVGKVTGPGHKYAEGVRGP